MNNLFAFLDAATEPSVLIMGGLLSFATWLCTADALHVTAQVFTLALS